MVTICAWCQRDGVITKLKELINITICSRHSKGRGMVRVNTGLSDALKAMLAQMEGA